MSAAVETTPSAGASGRTSGGGTESGGAAGAAVDREALLGRISELQEGANAGSSHEKVVAKEMKRLEKKIDDMAPDKAVKHLMAQLRETLVREREVTAAAATAKSELSKALAVRTRLEALCRGLQDSNRAIKEESRLAQEAEMLKRAELSKQFQGTIDDIQSRISADEAHKSKQLEEHKKLALKLDQIAEQNDSRVEQFAKLLEAKDLECQLLTAKLNHQTQLTALEQKKAEGVALEMAQLKANEAVLKGEFQEYGKRFEVLNKALTDSSAAFDSYRKEIEQTRKELAKLTKEKATMQARYNKVNAALVVAHQEKSAVEEALRVAMAKTTALEGLCRALRQGQNAPSATEESACVTTDDVVVESAGGDEPSAQ